MSRVSAAADPQPLGLAALHDELETVALAGTNAESARRSASITLARGLVQYFGLQADATDHSPPTHADSRLSVLRPDDPVGAARAVSALFERSTGEIGRRNQGAVYTPPDVATFMVREAFGTRIATELDISLAAARKVVAGSYDALTAVERSAIGRLVAGIRIVDPAAGAGVFLICAAEELARMARHLQRAHVSGVSSFTTLPGALARCHGFELDKDAAEIARSVIALATGVPCIDTKFGPISHRDVLIDGLAHPDAPDGWDIVVMNPPYLGEKFLRLRLGDETHAALKARDGFAGDLLEHFILRALDGLGPDGVVSAIVSDTMLTMDSSAPMRRVLLEQARLASIAWTRPFKTVAVNAAILTLARAGRDWHSPVEHLEGETGTDLLTATRKRVAASSFCALPNAPLFRPSPSANAVIRCWRRVDELDVLWSAVAKRTTNARRDRDVGTSLGPGDWTLLGAVTRSGQGLATGDDRRFVGYIAGSDDAQRATRRQARILDAIQSDPARDSQRVAVQRAIRNGGTQQDALLALLDDREIGGNDLPERKPFRVVQPNEIRTGRLSADDAKFGIASGPTWVPYETSDRSSARGGARWWRANPVVIDWSRDSVSLLRARQANGPRKPVMRNQDLWFSGGVTHNRIASYLRARLLPPGSIFSSESPIYVSEVDWLDAFVLVALINAPIVEFALKTFLSSRNHLEVGHLRRLPVPVLAASHQATLRAIGKSAVQAARDNDEATLHTLAGELDECSRELYGVPARMSLSLRR